MKLIPIGLFLVPIVMLAQSYSLCEEACSTMAIQLAPPFETCEHEVFNLLAEKGDLLVNHDGKNKDYNFYRHAGVTMVGQEGAHINEEKPVDLKSNLP